MIQQILNNINPNQLNNFLENLNPIESLKQLNISEKDAENIMSGNTSSLEKFDNEILDFDIILQRYNKDINVNLIKYFFKKAKNKESFTDEEISIYQTAWENWFTLVFKLGQNYKFCISDKLNDITIIIKVENDFFQMSSYQGINQIIWLENWGKELICFPQK